MPNPVVPGTTIPGAFIPGDAEPGGPGLLDNYVTVGTDQNVSGTKAFSALATFTGGINVTDATSPGLLISHDGTITAEGAFVVRQDDYAVNGGWFGLYDPNNNLYYGVSARLPSPAGTSTVGGYYSGLGIAAFSAGAGNPIFGILNESQSGNGLGNVTMTAYDNNKIVTFNSVLDDGSGNMTIAGGLAQHLRTVTASVTLSATDSTVLLNGATLTATLPTAAGITGRVYTIKQVSASTGTVATTSSQTIDGSATVTLAQYKYVTVQSDGSNWLITGNN